MKINDNLFEDDENKNKNEEIIDDDYEPDFFDELDDDQDFQDDKLDNSIKKKDYYVKAADLKTEIKRYQDTKAASPNRKRIYF